MALDYTINWSDGTLKAPFTLAATTINNTTTSLDLTGKGAVNWGEALQENLLKLLENHASNGTTPRAPTRGQTWFNALDNYLNVYTATGFKQLSFRRIDSTSAPSGTRYTGDLWYDTTNDRLRVRDLSANNVILATEADITNVLNTVTTQTTGKQDTLISGLNIKTINGSSILGSGDLVVAPTLRTINGTSLFGAGDIDTTPILKTVDGQSLIGSGNITSSSFGTTWTNMLSQRSLRTWYQNTTGKYIVVFVRVANQYDWSNAWISVNHTTPSSSGAVIVDWDEIPLSYYNQAGASAIIPPGAYYIAYGSVGYAVAGVWAELR